MGAPYEEFAEDVFDYGPDWRGHADGQEAGGGGAFSASSQEATLTGYVDGNKLRSALRYFLGFASVDESDDGSGGTTYLLRREPPARHPLFPQLYCHAVGFVGLGLDTADRPNEPVYLESVFNDYLGTPIKYTPFEQYLLTVKFKSFGRTLFLPDEEMEGYDPPHAYEWLRWTEITIGPQVQALTADGSSNLVFREGGGGTAPTANTTAFPAPIAELLAKCAFTVKWMQVPHEWVSDNQYYLFPSKVISCLGRVNDADFIGHPKGTILCTGAAFEPVLYPVAPADPSDPATGWDITFIFEQYDPEKGVGASEYRGHRVFPWRVDGKHYYATRSDNTRELLPLVDMYTLFENINA